MNELFKSFNSQWRCANATEFAKKDKHLNQLATFPNVYKAPISKSPPSKIGIYTVTGGHGTGKTTLVKKWFEALMINQVPPTSLIYIPGNKLTDTLSLINTIKWAAQYQQKYLVIDEVTDIRNWLKAITYSATIGLLENLYLILISEDKRIQSQIDALKLDKILIKHHHIFPLSLRECIDLKYSQKISKKINLYDEFTDYLQHGGYLPALSDLAIHHKILDTTLNEYIEHIFKRMKDCHKLTTSLNELLNVILQQGNKAVSLNKLSRIMLIKHPNTIKEYLNLLASHDIIYIQAALDEKKLTAAPKKPHKLMFANCFIYHACHKYIKPSLNTFSTQIQPLSQNNLINSTLVKLSTITQYSHHFPVFYLKKKGHIDLAYLYKDSFWPVLISWTDALLGADLNQLLTYHHGKILTNTSRSGLIEHIRTEPLPQALWRLDEDINDGR